MHNQKIGKIGEDLAADFLTKKGYKIIDRNVKIGYQELDVVALEKNEFVFIEVKTRTSLKYGSADESLNHKKIKNLKFAILQYLAVNKVKTKNVRLDLVAIDINQTTNNANIKHYSNIF